MPREGEKEEAGGRQARKEEEEEQEKHDSKHRVQGKAGRALALEPLGDFI